MRISDWSSDVCSSDLLLRRGLCCVCCHLGVEIKQLLQSFGVVLEATTDIDTLQHFIVVLVGTAKVLRHGVWVIQVGDGGGEVCFAGQQNIRSEERGGGEVGVRQCRSLWSPDA